VEYIDLRAAPPRSITVIGRRELQRTALALSDEGERLLIGSAAGGLEEWDATTHEIQVAAAPSGDTEPITAVALGSAPGVRAAARDSGTIEVWAWHREPFTVLGGPGPAPRAGRTRVTVLAFSPDDSELAAGNDAGAVVLWRKQEGITAGTLAERPSARTATEVTSVAFDATGEHLAAGRLGREVLIWKSDQPSDVPRALPPTEGICVDEVSCNMTWVTFDDAASSVAAGWGDGSVWRWPESTRAVADLVCDVVWRNLDIGEWRAFVGEGIPFRDTCE
jgi:WD40 repeat protein